MPDGGDAAYERAMQLFIRLVGASRPIATRHLLAQVPGYLGEELADEIDACEGPLPDELRKARQAADRMLRRDLDLLKRLNLHVVSEPSGEWDDDGNEVPGYRIAPDTWATRGLEVTPEQKDLLAVAASMARSELESPGSEDALFAVQKVLRGRKPAEPASVSVSLGSEGSDPRSRETTRKLHLFARLVNAHRTARFVYRKLDRTSAERTVDVYALAERLGTWYAVGRDHKDDEVKCFRISRVEGDPAEVKGSAFEVPADFDAAKHVHPSWDIGEDRTEVTLAFDPAIEHIACANLPGLAVAVDAGGDRCVTVPVANLNGFVRWVMTMDEHAWITAPPEARSAAREMLTGVAAAHA